MFNAKIPLSGHYKLQTKNADTGEVTRTLEFDNIITNSGLDQIGGHSVNGSTPFNEPLLFIICCVGTGTAPENITDTLLGQLFAHSQEKSDFYATAFVEEQAGPPHVPAYWSGIRKWRFQAGTFNNTNLSEVGTSDNPNPYASNYTLFSRSLIKDENGNPTTITVLQNELLDVTYELRVYIDKTQYPFTFSSGVATYTGQAGMYDITNVPILDRYYITDVNFSGRIYVSKNLPVDTTAYGSFSATANERWQVDAYQPGSFQNIFRATIPLNEGNFETRGIAISASRLQYRWIIDSPGPEKTNIEKMDIGIKVSWGRYTP